jgi:hypothetical protein
MSKLAIVAGTLLAVFGGGQPVLAEARSTAYVVITRARTPWSQPTSRMGVAFA